MGEEEGGCWSVQAGHKNTTKTAHTAVASRRETEKKIYSNDIKNQKGRERRGL